jgi:hypothetical protein
VVLQAIGLVVVAPQELVQHSVCLHFLGRVQKWQSQIHLHNINRKKRTIKHSAVRGREKKTINNEDTAREQ